MYGQDLKWCIHSKQTNGSRDDEIFPSLSLRSLAALALYTVGTLDTISRRKRECLTNAILHETFFLDCKHALVISTKLEKHRVLDEVPHMKLQ